MTASLLVCIEHGIPKHVIIGKPSGVILDIDQHAASEVTN